MATEREIKIFRDLIERGVNQDRAKSLIIKSREAPETEVVEETPVGGLAQRALSDAEEFIGRDTTEKDTGIEKTPDTGLGADIKERGETIVEKFAEKQTIFNPQLKENIKQKLGETEKGQDILKGVEIMEGVLSKVPGSENIKNRVENSIDQHIKRSALVGESAGVVNDIIGAGIGEVLELTGADKLLEAAAETETGQAVGEIIQEGTQVYNELEKIAPGLATDINTGLQLTEFTGFGKAGKAGKRTLGKLPRPTVRNQELANKLVDTTLKFSKNQKTKFKKPNFAKGESPAEYLLRKGLVEGAKSTDDIVDGLENLVTNSKKAVDKTLANIGGTFKKESVNKALNVITKQLDETPGMEDLFNRARELRQKAVQGAGLTMSEVNEVKRIIDQTNDLVNVTGEFKTGVTKQGLTNLRQDIQKFIEDTAESKGVTNIADLNKDTQLSRELLNNIAGNLEESGRTRIFGLTDILVGGGATLGGDFGLGLGIVASKKVLESDRFKLALARNLNKIPADRLKDIKTKIGKNETLTGVDKVLITNAITQAVTETE